MLHHRPALPLRHHPVKILRIVFLRYTEQLIEDSTVSIPVLPVIIPVIKYYISDSFRHASVLRMF